MGMEFFQKTGLQIDLKGGFRYELTKPDNQIIPPAENDPRGIFTHLTQIREAFTLWLLGERLNSFVPSVAESDS